MKQRWYNQNVKLFLSAVLLPPMGIYGLVKRETLKTGLRVAGIVITAFYTLVYGFILAALIAVVFIGGDKLNFDKGMSALKSGEYESAKRSFEQVDADSEYFNSAKQQIRTIDSIMKIALVLTEQNDERTQKLQKDAERFRIAWSDSVVKSWKGEFIVGYVKPITDTIYFELSKNASKDFENNRDSNLPMYLASYNLSMKNKLGNDYKDSFVIEFIQNEEAIKEIRFAAERRDKILRQFSAWNGEHHNLKRAIKRAMNDPDSYDHVETAWADKGTYIQVQTTIRGTNALGAKVLNTYTATVDLDGNVLSIE